MRDTRHLEIFGLTRLVLYAAGQPERLNPAITQPIATPASAGSCLEFGLLLLKNEARMNMSLRQETTSQRAATNVPVCALILSSPFELFGCLSYRIRRSPWVNIFCTPTWPVPRANRTCSI